MGPLAGVKVVELAALGPVPFACMLLSEMGADVVQVRRLDASDDSHARPSPRLSERGRRSILLDLKSEDGASVIKRMVANADVLVEGFRPGVMERLALGPEVCEEINPKIIYARMTGWGQTGPLAHSAGHDLNYIALAGALHGIGTKGGPPIPPLNYIGDFGGGAMYLVFGILAALYERVTSGRGQVIDAAITDGTISLMASVFTQMARGDWSNIRGTNLSDGGRPWYNVYETRDGKYISVAPIEMKFYAELLRLTGLSDQHLPAQHDRSGSDELSRCFAGLFIRKTREEWCELLEGSDACFAPVLTPGEAAEHPHNKARQSFSVIDGIVQPSAAPRLSRTPGAVGRPPPRAGEHTRVLLEEAGFSLHEIAGLFERRVVG